MRRLYWIISVVFLLLICVYLFNYFYQVEKQLKINEIVGHQRIHAKQASKSFIQLFDKWNSVLSYLSNDSNIVAFNKTGATELERLTRILKDEIKAITRTDKNGRIIFTTPANPSSLGADISRQKHMVKILATHEPVVSEVFDAVQGYKAVAIHYPVFRNRDFAGTIAFVLDFEEITRSILDDIKIGKSGYAWMISSEGIELYCPIKEHIGKSVFQTGKAYPELLHMVGDMLMGKEGTTFYYFSKTANPAKNELKIAHYLPIRVKNTFWSLAVTFSVNEITSSLVSFRNRLMVIFSIIFLGSIYLSYFGIKAWIIVKESQLREIAEKELRESEEKYRTVIETTDTGYAIMDENGRIVDANMNYVQMTGHKAMKEINGRNVAEWVSSKDLERYNAHMELCITKGNVQNLEIEYQHKNSSKIPVEINAHSLLSDGRKYIIMLCRDITDRYRTQETLRKERSLLRTLIDNLPSGVFVKDKEFKTILANKIHLDSLKGHLKYYGMDSEMDIIGKTDFEIFPKEQAEAFYEDDRKVIEEGNVILNQEEEGIGPESNQIWLLVSKVPIRDLSGEIIGMVGVTNDITQRKKAEVELKEAKERAEQSDRLKTAFLNNISHEIRTPLNAIIGFTDLLKEQEFSKEKSLYYIDIINQSGNQLLMIITDIINIATIEAGQLKLKPSNVNVNSMVQSLFNQHKANAENKKIQFYYETSLKDDEALVVTDFTKLLEVMSNLINNAIKFTEAGFVRYGYKPNGQMLQFYVEDTGIGIQPEYHQTIFDRFHRVDSYLASKYGGMGLGLSITKAYVELMGGKIWLNSQPGNGTTFYFTIPYTRA